MLKDGFVIRHYINDVVWKSFLRPTEPFLATAVSRWHASCIGQSKYDNVQFHPRNGVLLQFSVSLIIQ